MGNVRASRPSSSGRLRCLARVGPTCVLSQIRWTQSLLGRGRAVRFNVHVAYRGFGDEIPLGDTEHPEEHHWEGVL